MRAPKDPDRGRGAWRLVTSVVAMVLLLGGCDWAMFGSDAAHTRANSESVVAPDNRLAMSTLFTAATGDDVFSSPAVANGVVYVGSLDGKLYVFDADASTNCSSGVVACSPLWTATTGGRVVGSPAVANGKVYIGSDDNKLYVFDAAGNTSCSGSPKTCLPLWTATAGDNVQSSPVVSGDVVYVGSDDSNLYAFDAAGNTNCVGSPKVCTPLWTAPTGGPINSSPAVSGGVVYVGSDDHKLYAVSAAGRRGVPAHRRRAPRSGRLISETSCSPRPPSPTVWCTSGRSTTSCMRSTRPAAPTAPAVRRPAYRSGPR